MIGEFDMELTQKLANGYKKANKKRKGEILTEYCSLTEVSRNTASKRFQKEIIRRCWELGGNICAERLHTMLPTYLDQLYIRGMLKTYSRDQIEKTRSIPLGTMKFPAASRRVSKITLTVSTPL